jgi:uncharacterized protein (TIGR03083 family)
VDPERGPSPREVADLIGRLRADSVATLVRLTDADLATPALPGWSVGDVYRHLASSDRAAVTGRLLPHLAPGRRPEDLEPANDELVASLRGLGRDELCEELQRWGRRMVQLVRTLPSLAGRQHVPSAFGRVPLIWLATLRVYDEWVHQTDVAAALERPEPAMEAPVRDVLAWFQRRALPATALPKVEHDRGVVEVSVTDAAGPTWRVDLAERRFGAHVDASTTVRVRMGVPAWCLLAADRASWPELEAAGRLEVLGPPTSQDAPSEDDRAAAAAVLDTVRVV